MRFAEVLTAAQARVVEDLQARDRRERAEGRRDPLGVRAVAPEVAQLLYLLVVHKRAQTAVEFGTSHGYSTIHLAAAAERTGGRVYSVDAMPEKAEQARQNLEAAGLLHRVTLVTSDGADFAASLPAGIDFVLVDYPIPAFERAFEPLRARIAPGCFLFIDGGPEGYWEGAGRSFRAALERDSAFVVTILPMRKDQLIAVRVA